MMKRKNQKTASKKINRMTNKMVITIHHKTDKINPVNPSPASKPGKSGVIPEFGK
jgi:hypothetical protein